MQNYNIMHLSQNIFGDFCRYRNKASGMENRLKRPNISALQPVLLPPDAPNWPVF